jgi:hypothetical protein
MWKHPVVFPIKLAVFQTAIAATRALAENRADRRPNVSYMMSHPIHTHHALLPALDITFAIIVHERRVDTKRFQAGIEDDGLLAIERR